MLGLLVPTHMETGASDLKMQSHEAVVTAQLNLNSSWEWQSSQLDHHHHHPPTTT